MILRSNKKDRREDILYATWQCQASRGKRVPYYNKCRDLYLYGGDPSVITRANKIKPAINNQSSFLYAPHLIKFWMEVPPEEEEAETYDRVDPAVDSLGLAWHDSGVGKIFKRGVTWALVYGSTIMSILPRLRTDRKVEIVADWVHPQNFGVWDDMQPEIEKQEAVCLTSYLSLEQIKRIIRHHPNRREIENSLQTGDRQQAAFEGMITTPPNATVFDIKPEFWNWYSKQFDYRPTYRMPIYEVTDTYIFDDDLEDYRICTTTGDFVIWDRPMSDCAVPGMLPFVKICADEHPEWFWGISLADDLSKLQMWYVQRMDDLDKLCGRAADPPVAAIGVGQSFDEKIDTYKRRSGKITLPAGADLKSFQPDIPAQLFELIGGVDTMIQEQAGHRFNMLGKDEKAGRGGGGLEKLLRIAGSQMLSKAYDIELNAQDCGSLLQAYERRYKDAHLIDEKGRPFLLANFPSDTKVRVDGHSSSPIFAEDAFQVGVTLKRLNVITDEMLLGMANIPNLSRAKHDLRIIGFQKAIAEQVVRKQQELKRSGEPAAK